MSKDAKKIIEDLKVVGNPDTWKLICSVSSEAEGWMKSTKGLRIPGAGVLIQVSTQQGDHVAEALAFLPHVCLIPENEKEENFTLIGTQPVPEPLPDIVPDPLPDIIQKLFELLTEQIETTRKVRKNADDKNVRYQERLADLFERCATLHQYSEDATNQFARAAFEQAAYCLNKAIQDETILFQSGPKDD